MSRNRNKEALIFSKARDPEFYMKTIRGENGILTRIFLEILLKLKVTPIGVGKLLGDYIRNPNNVPGNSTKDRVSAKGNLVKELGKNSMTWKNFMHAIRFVQIVRFRIIFIGWTVNNDPVKIKVDVSVSDSPIMHKNIPFSEEDYAPPTYQNNQQATSGSTGIRPEFISPTAKTISDTQSDFQNESRG